MNGTPEENFGKQSYYTLVSEGDQSNVETKDVLVITNAEQLKEVFATINSTRKPGIVMPEVDWKEESVIAAFVGTKSTAGYGLTIFQVRDKENERIYKFEEILPASGNEVVSMVMTTPYMIIKVKNDDKKITASF